MARFEDRYRDTGRPSTQTLEERGLYYEEPEVPFLVTNTGRVPFQPPSAPPVSYPGVDVRLGESPFTAQYEPGREPANPYLVSGYGTQLDSDAEQLARYFNFQDTRPSGLVAEYGPPEATLGEVAVRRGEDISPLARDYEEGREARPEVGDRVPLGKPLESYVGDPYAAEARQLLEAPESFMDKWMREGREAFGKGMNRGQLESLFGQGLQASKAVEQVEAGKGSAKGVEKKALRLSDTAFVVYDPATGVSKVTDTSGKGAGKTIKASGLTGADRTKWEKNAREQFKFSLANLVTTTKGEGQQVIVNMAQIMEGPEDEQTKMQALGEAMPSFPRDVQTQLVNQFNAAVMGKEEGDAGFQKFEDIMKGFGTKEETILSPQTDLEKAKGLLR